MKWLVKLRIRLSLYLNGAKHISGPYKNSQGDWECIVTYWNGRLANKHMVKLFGKEPGLPFKNVQLRYDKRLLAK